MGMSVQDLSLPPGFRFFPTDEELLVEYLCRKVAGHSFSLQIIAEIDLYKHDPWILPSKAVFGEKEWYFFSPRDRKYPNGSRPNRVAGSGYWKATGTDKIITTEGHKIGIKKALVFYVGKAPKGTKTNWIMHEFRLLETSRKHNSSRLDDWVLCRVYKKGSASHHHQKALLNSNVLNSNDQQSEFSCNSSNSTNSSSQFDDVLDSLTEIEDRSFALPRINSFKSFQDQKIANNNFNNYYSQNLMSSCKLDWSNGLPAGMTEYASNGAHHGVGLGTETSDVYYPSVPPLEDEVESGIGGSGSTGVTHLYHADSLDPFGLRYVMTQQVPGGSW